MPLSPGQVLNNRYRIVKLLGQGGFGAVYRVWDTNLDRPRALKENLDISSQAQRQFRREAQILSDLTHPNLPKVIDHFVVSGQGQYLVMDFVEGEDLKEMIDRFGGPLPEAQSLSWVRQICDALTYLHSQNPPVIHRDIKPANIKITPEGKAMLVDFGIAKIFDPHLITTVGARAVTPGYSPPEQYGGGTTEERSDVFALGATLYTLLTGQTPPPCVDIISGGANAPAPSHILNPTVSPPVSAAVERAMRVNRAERFRSAAEFKAALLGEETAAPVLGRQVFRGSPISRPALTPLSRPIPKGWIGASGALLLVVAILILIFFVGSNGTGGSDTSATQTALALVARSTLTSRPKPQPSNPIESSPTSALLQMPTEPPEPTDTPTPTKLPKYITDAHGVSMALVEAGAYQMGGNAEVALSECQKLYIGSGCEGSWFEDEEPVHTITLDDFYIDLYEVTNTLFADFLNAQGNQSEGGVTWFDTVTSYARIQQSGGEWRADSSYADHPVVYVTWYGARAFCEWREARLPTEAEWEVAASGGDGRIYPWGDAFAGQLTNFCDANCTEDWANKDYNDGHSRTAPVGSYEGGVSPYGLFNMAGNVWEWVMDWYDENYYVTSPSENPTGPNNGVDRVIRGGSWSSSGYYLRVTNRGWYSPDDSDYNRGLRCAVSP